MKTGGLTIITANVSWKNPAGKRIVRKLHRKKADIVCVQEIMHRHVEELKVLGYAVGQAEDYRHEKGMSSYVATGIVSKKSVISLERVRYSEKKVNSIAGWYIYGKIAKLHERYEAVLATFRWKGKIYRLVNAHLSIACRPQDRVAQLEVLLRRYADGRTMFCGDFNIVSDSIFRLLFGWLLGYRLVDFFYDERREVNRLIKQYKLQNIFAHKKTVRWPFRQQFDHILIPIGWQVKKKRMLRLPLSDHRALFATIVPV